MSKWFRFYTSVLGDKKVQRLPATLFRSWVNTLCVAASENDGIIPPLEEYAYEMRISKAEAQEVLQSLQDKELLDNVNGILRPHNWDNRQYKSDVSTERAKRSKQRSKQRSLQQHGNGVSDIQITDTPIVPYPDDISDLVSSMIAEHPNQDRAETETLVCEALVQVLPDAVNFRAEVEAIYRVHSVMSQSHEWTKDGAAFCPKLTKWIKGKTWARSNGQKPKYVPNGVIA